MPWYNEDLEIPEFLKRVKESKPKSETKVHDSPQKQREAANKRAHDIAESCRSMVERTRLEKNALQLEEYHKLKDYYDLVNDHLFSKEAKDSRVSGKVTSEEKKRYNVYIKCGVTPQALAQEVLRWRLLESGQRS